MQVTWNGAGPSLQGTREVINESFNIALLIANEGAPKSIQQLVSIAHSWVVPPSINIVTETKIACPHMKQKCY